MDACERLDSAGIRLAEAKKSPARAGLGPRGGIGPWEYRCSSIWRSFGQDYARRAITARFPADYRIVTARAALLSARGPGALAFQLLEPRLDARIAVEIIARAL